MTKTILRIEGLTKYFPGVCALKNVDFDLVDGEIHAVCGENGAGKSTLIGILAGVHPVGSYEGALTLFDTPAEFHTVSDAGKAGIAVIYQELALVQEMTVAENIFLGTEPGRLGLIDWNILFRRAQEYIDRLNLDIDPAERVKNLGMGQQQLVEIIKALSKKPRILLLDEPTSALTESEVDILLGVIRDLKDRGITCIYISHKLDEVLALADRITVLRDGEKICTLNRSATDKQTIIRHMVGREIKNFFPRRKTRPGKTLLRVDALSVAGSKGDRHVLENISFELKEGEVLGLGGLMGAGRTELLMHLVGAFGERVSGSVILNGEPLPVLSPGSVIKKGVILVTEDRKQYGLHLEQSVEFNLSLASLRQCTGRIFIDKNRERQRNQKIFDMLTIKAPGLDVPVSGLSGGNQQKVVVGKGLLTEPSVILLDEPTRGIDVGAKIEIYELINTLTEQGKTVLFASSELPELMGMSDRMLILSNGKIGGAFSGDETNQESILTAAMAHN